MGSNSKELSLIVAKQIAEKIYQRVTNKLAKQAVFFDGKRFKIAPENGGRIQVYLNSNKLKLVAYYSEPDYEMVFDDVCAELALWDISTKQYKLRKRWLGY